MYKIKNKNNNILLSSIVLMMLIATSGLSNLALANAWPSAGSLELIKSTCKAGPSQYQELSQLKDQIRTATSVKQARELALAPTDNALGALKNARIMMPFSDDLQMAETRLDDARSRILLASSQEQVADEFDGMMLAGLDNDRAAHVNIGSGSCNYSTGELIAIVVGLILGIIPGLILLVVLC
ncbi:MAG: hypothetical protein ABL933_18565 [Methyloglobulus sp.]|nr:hypothetical protein [Methyloglobulus sp.]